MTSANSIGSLLRLPALEMDRAHAPVASDWKVFDPLAYLAEYYGDVGPENTALLHFFAEAYQNVPKGGVLLDFGGGPTIYPLISAANRFSEIHISDYLESNLDELRRWLARHPDAFDWSEFVARALEIETGRTCTREDVANREREIRARVTRVLPCDASSSPAVESPRRCYDVVLSNFCAESATSDRAQWHSYMENIVSLLRPGGWVLVSALKGATSYSVGPRSFPAVNIAEDDLLEFLEESGFSRKRIDVRTVPADRPSRDYEGLMLAFAEKDAQ